MTFCRFDEFEDAVLSIELAAENFSEVQNSPTLWKWVLIAMQNAVQSAMVLALAGTDGCGALYPKSQKQNREWLQNPTPDRQRRAMADYNTLLAWIQRAELLQGPVPPLSDEDCRNLERLNELRRQFAHYNPTGWGIELQYMLNIMPAAADVFEHLTETQGRPNIYFTPDQKRRMGRSLCSGEHQFLPCPQDHRSVLSAHSSILNIIRICMMLPGSSTARGVSADDTETSTRGTWSLFTTSTSLSFFSC
jgi:hypothetical protein